MSLCCIYHKEFPMRVVEDDVGDQMVTTGEWFNHPNCIKEENYHEKQIRQQPRKRRKHGENASQSS